VEAGGVADALAGAAAAAGAALAAGVAESAFEQPLTISDSSTLAAMDVIGEVLCAAFM
jgi:hypothetical protein